MPPKNSRQSGRHPPQIKGREPPRRDTSRPELSLPVAGNARDDFSHTGRELSVGTQQRAPDIDAYNCDDEDLPPALRNPQHDIERLEEHGQHNKKAPGVFQRVIGFVYPKPASKLSQQPYANTTATAQSSRKTHEKNYARVSKPREEDSDQLAKLKQEFARTLESHEIKESELQNKVQDLQHQIQEMNRTSTYANSHPQASHIDEIAELKYLLGCKDEALRSGETQWKDYTKGMVQHIREMEHTASIQQAKIQNLESERENIQDEHEAFIRKQQELSFQQMTTSRWLPVEDTKVMADLDRLKREMRGWAKKNSMKDIALLELLDEGEQISLWNALAKVVRFESRQISEEVRSLRSPTLLLNALLTHDVYMCFFRNPFFIFSEDPSTEHHLPRPRLDSMLGEIYQRTQRSNQEDAHIWRSQTLRLLLPPMRNDTSNGEKELHNRTQEMITTVADQRVFEFLQGPARYMISDKAEANCDDKLRAIYREAASVSYMLWTRRTMLRCWALEDMGRPLFQPDSKELVPHSSVNFEDHEDQLEGRPITILVHPLLKAYGTDDAKDYDRERVWAPAEVWLDSRD